MYHMYFMQSGRTEGFYTLVSALFVTSRLRSRIGAEKCVQITCNGSIFTSAKRRSLLFHHRFTQIFTDLILKKVNG